jgi:hypothetical protein
MGSRAGGLETGPIRWEMSGYDLWYETLEPGRRRASSGERAFVQVKSQATAASLDYVARLAQAEAYDRMFFVWHTGDIAEEDGPAGVILLGPQKLSHMVLDAGLSSWLREKVS